MLHQSAFSENQNNRLKPWSCFIISRVLSVLSHKSIQSTEPTDFSSGEGYNDIVYARSGYTFEAELKGWGHII